MQRRKFLSATLAASAATLSPMIPADPQAQAQSKVGRQYFELRRYSLMTGAQSIKLTEAYLAEALIPALVRAGIGPIGAFRLDYGPDTPAIYLLLPAASPDELITLPGRLGRDAEFLKLAAPFNTVSAGTPAFQRVDSSLLLAFESFPTLHAPVAGRDAQRIFQLRIYENATPQAHERKIELFNQGEIDIFKHVGFEPVFFGETILGPRMPNIAYMLTFKDLTDLTAKWDVFKADPTWKKLNTSPRYGYEALVSNITNLVLSPTPYSQI